MPASAPAPTSTTPAGSPAARRRRRRRHPSEVADTGVIQVAEEAFQLLRTTPADGLWLYFVGTVPFALAVFYFWADMSRSSHAASDAALGSAGLALAYGWMKVWQGLFCRRLWEQLHPSGKPLRLSRTRWLRHAAAQVLIHSLSLPVRMLTLLLIGWTGAFFQNATVQAFSQDFGRQPLRRTIAGAASLAHRDWAANYVNVLLMGVIAFFVWINVVGTVALVPMALKIFFGIETVFTLNPGATLMNTTFIFASLLLTFLVIDPMMKAIHTLRCFRGISRSTGADLLSRLARSRGAASLGAILLIVSAAPAPLSAQDSRQPVRAEETGANATAEDLMKSIEETLRQKEYQWRYPRRDDSGDETEKSWLARQFEALAKSIQRGGTAFGEMMERLMRRLFENERARPAPSGAAPLGAGIGLAAKIALVATVTALLIWVLVMVLMRSREARPALADEAGLTGPVDLESDAIVATQLPEDEWLRLAREQIARGDHRLAVRALFLATLAHLGDRGLLKVARFKSNRDYTRELQLKARALAELRSAFSENVGLFERAWYGLHEIGREASDRFLANYERITLQSAAVPAPGAPVLPPAR